MMISRNSKSFHIYIVAQIVYLIILSASIKAAPNGPRIEIKPAVTLVFLEAQSVSNKVLTCKALGDKPGMFNSLKWTGPNRQDNWDELKKRHHVRESTRNGHSLELDFTRPTPDDSGIYYCLGTYQSSDTYNASIEVRVFNPIKLENCPDRQFVIEGAEQQKITCRITGDSPIVSFMKDDTTIEQFEKRYKWDNDDGLVILGPVNKQDAGRYTIEVTTEMTGDRKVLDIIVEVHSKPEIIPYNPTNDIAEFTGIEGEQAELKCEVSGTPRPLVYWLDPKLRNVTSGVGGYFVNLEKGTLLISKVNRNDDNGNFQCVAYNTVSETRRNVAMAVYQRPAITVFENKTVDEGSDVTFECRATGFPKPRLSIRRGGLNQQPYQLGDANVTDFHETEEYGGVQVVYVYRVKVQVSRLNFGLHYCNATNIAGSAERVGQLMVKYAPDLSLTPPEQFVKIGKNVTLTCHIRAYPPPTVNWYGDNQQILNIQDSNFKTSPDGQTHIVTMMPPMRNIQRFKCVASNDKGFSDRDIIPRFTTAPSIVSATVVDRKPTSIKLRLVVLNDGGDRVKTYKYRAEGYTMDPHNPTFRYPANIQNETYIDASPSISDYTIQNLLPYYKYRISIRAVNDVGEGDLSDVHVETLPPAKPEPPIILKPNVNVPSTGFLSDYQDGYILRWGPPDSDNGDPVEKYIVKINRVNSDDTNNPLDLERERIIEQMNERPMYARLTSLDVDSHYRILLQARNKYGDSEPASIVIYTPRDKPPMPNNDPQPLPWLTEPSTTLIMALLVFAILFLVIIDIVFCLCFQIGVSYAFRNCFCPPKASSVISDKT